MRYTWMDEFLLSKNGVTKDLQKDWNWIRYQIGGKMFAAICLGEKNEPYYITLKLEPAEGDFLRSQYEDIIPGYYMNKTHWNSIMPDGEVPDDLLKDLLDKSYQLVLSGFSKKKQIQIAGSLEIENKEDISCCGTNCMKCSCYGSKCSGCNNCKGMVFHAPKGKPCAIYECAVTVNKFKDCSECEKLPCDIWRKTKDPSYTVEEFEENIKKRVKKLHKVK